MIDALFCFHMSLHYLSGSPKTFAAFGVAPLHQQAQHTALITPDWGLMWEMKKNHFVEIGSRLVGGYYEPFGLLERDRTRHLYVVGGTGSGKSSLLYNLAVQDIEAGYGVAFFDPHGDDCEKLLDAIPPHRIRDVIYFNPADEVHPMGFNLLRTDDRKHLVTAGIVETIENIWSSAWGIGTFRFPREPSSTRQHVRLGYQAKINPPEGGFIS